MKSLNKIIFINSADKSLKFAEINLDGNVHFIGTQGVDEVQKMLPFVHTYWDNDILYTETISSDFMLGSPSTVAFYIQSSDLGRDDTILANYNFRVVLIW